MKANLNAIRYFWTEEAAKHAAEEMNDPDVYTSHVFDFCLGSGEMSNDRWTIHKSNKAKGIPHGILRLGGNFL